MYLYNAYILWLSSTFNTHFLDLEKKDITFHNTKFVDSSHLMRHRWEVVEFDFTPDNCIFLIDSKAFLSNPF